MHGSTDPALTGQDIKKILDKFIISTAQNSAQSHITIKGNGPTLENLWTARWGIQEFPVDMDFSPKLQQSLLSSSTINMVKKFVIEHYDICSIK